MNLSAPTKIFAVLACWCCLLGVWSCERAKNLGTRLQGPGEQLQIVFTDTVTIRASTVLLDSIKTSESNIYLAGRYRDPALGVIRSSFFALFAPNDTVISLLGTAPRYDSIALRLAMPASNASYGDTTKTQTFRVHRVTQDLNDTIYFNYSTVAFDPTPLGQRTFSIQNLTQELGAKSMTIRLADNFGQQIFNLAAQRLTISALLQTIKGLTVQPNDIDDAGIAGFGIGGIQLIMYYTDVNDGSAKQLTLFINNFRSFTNIQNDRSGSPITSLNGFSQPLASANSNQQTVVHNALGIATLLEFPYLQAFKNLGNTIITKAELVLYLANNSFSLFFKQPSRIAFTEMTNDNRVIRDFNSLPVFVQQDGAPLQETRAPLVAGFGSIFSGYPAIITNHFKRMIDGIKSRKMAVREFIQNPFQQQNPLLDPTNRAARIGLVSMNRMVFNANRSELKSIRLELYYAVIR